MTWYGYLELLDLHVFADTENHQQWNKWSILCIFQLNSCVWQPSITGSSFFPFYRYAQKETQLEWETIQENLKLFAEFDSMVAFNFNQAATNKTIKVCTWADSDQIWMRIGLQGIIFMYISNEREHKEIIGAPLKFIVLRYANRDFMSIISICYCYLYLEFKHYVQRGVNEKLESIKTTSYVVRLLDCFIIPF